MACLPGYGLLPVAVLHLSLFWNVCAGEGLLYAPARQQPPLNILFVTFDAAGHFASYTGLWDGLARCGHNVTVAFPEGEASVWFDQARMLYENEHLDNLQALYTGEGIVKKLLHSDELKMVDDANPLAMLKTVGDALAEVTKGQLPLLDQFLQEQSTSGGAVDVIVHDFAAFSGEALCRKHNIPCVTLNVLMNDDNAGMFFWRPPLGVGLPPARPSIYHRVAFPLANLASRAVIAYTRWSVTGLVDMLLYNGTSNVGSDAGGSAAGLTEARQTLQFCRPAREFTLVTVTPGLDQAQITPPSVVFVGPMRDFTRYAPLKAPEQNFLDQALADGIPVVFIAAGVTAWITDSYAQARLALAEELTQDGAVRVLWATKRGVSDGELAAKITNKNELMVAKWLPQEAVLNHPATKVFVTHGGSTSMMESVAAGVPFLCSPFAFEQINNCILLQHRRMGVYVPEKAPTQDYVNGIREILLNHPFYADQVATVWKRVIAFGEGEDAFGARRAVHIVESIGVSGNEYLRPEICDWPAYQLFHLDVGIVYLMLAAVGFWMLRLCIGFNRSRSATKRKTD